MSRCFPYPPPWYERRRARGDALIESIEIQREREAETGKRKEKRERKEKRHQHKKTKDKRTDDFSWNSKKLDEVPSQNENESERSALTEEHSQPVLVDSLSDGSDSSSKRKRAGAPMNAFERNGKKLRISFTLKKQPVLDLSIDEQQVCSTSVREVEHNVLPVSASSQTGNDLHKIGSSAEKLPKALFSGSKKTKSVTEHHVLPSNASNQSGNDFYKIGSSSEEKLPKVVISGSKKAKSVAEHHVLPSNASNQSGSDLHKIGSSSAEKLPKALFSGSKKTESVAEHHIRPSNASNQSGNDLHKIGSSSEEKLPKVVFSGSKKAKSVASQYKMLMEDWVPPPLSRVYDGEDDLDWLLPKKDQTCKRKAFEAQDGVLHNGGTNILPRACNLVEADIFALPYVTPF